MNTILTWLQCRLGVALVAVTLLAAGEAPGRCDGATDEIVGTWRGSSACVDRVAAPACNDEQVVYEISATPGKANTVTVNADKVVEGKRMPMGAHDLTRDAKDGGWMVELETPRVHAIWRLTVSGPTMQGNMTLLPSKAVVRRMDLRRDE
jgi:hypothetical protein